jgi:hypothetical protein
MREALDILMLTCEISKVYNMAITESIHSSGFEYEK